MGIGVIDGFQLHQRLFAAIGAPRHGAHRRLRADLSRFLQEGAFGLACLAVHQPEGDVAAKDDAAFSGDALGQRTGNGINASNGGDAKGDAGEKDVEAAQAAAQFTQRQAQRQVSGGRRADHDRHRALGRAKGGGGGGAAVVANQPAGIHAHGVATTAGQRRIMGDQKQRRPLLGRRLEDEIGDVAAGCGVEIAGRLVGNQKPWLHDQGASDGDALLLAARHLRRIMRQPLTEADAAEHVTGAVEGGIDAGQFQRHGDILQSRHGLHEMKRLENEADIAAAEGRQFVFAKPGIVSTGNGDPAGIDALQAGDDHQQGGLSGARRPDKPDGLAATDSQADAAKHMNARRAGAQRQIDIFKPYSRFAQDVGPYIAVVV